MTDREKILQRIKKLKAHAESAAEIGSVHEAENFMKSAIDLMTEYNISLIEVDATEIKQADEFKNWGYSEYVTYDDAKQGWEWKKDLMSVICRFNFCSYVFNKAFKMLRVYGNMENVDNTIWLYNYMSTGLFNLAQSHYKSVLAELRQVDKKAADKLCNRDAYKFKRDFLLGTIYGVQLQLQEKRDKAASNVRSLILYNNKALDTFLNKTNPDVKTVDRKCVNINHYDAYANGVVAGHTFSVNKPLTKNPDDNKKLLD